MPKTIHWVLIWDDQANHDDIVVISDNVCGSEDRPVKLIINSRDVIHDVGLCAFPYENGCCSWYSYHHVVYTEVYNGGNERK